MSDPAALSTVVGDRSEPAHGRSTTLDHNIRTAPTIFFTPNPRPGHAAGLRYEKEQAYRCDWFGRDRWAAEGTRPA
jgi:hypothetical protein